MELVQQPNVRNCDPVIGTQMQFPRGLGRPWCSISRDSWKVLWSHFRADMVVKCAQLYLSYRHINAVSSGNCSLNWAPLMFPVFQFKAPCLNLRSFSSSKLIQGLNMPSLFACKSLLLSWYGNMSHFKMIIWDSALNLISFQGAFGVLLGMFAA